MLREGASPTTLQALLGHATMQHLNCYLRLTIADVRRMHKGSRVGR